MGLYSGGLIIERIFSFQNGLGMTIKHPKTLRKQPRIASTNSPWAYIQEGLLSEGFLRLRFGELIFGRAYLFIYLFIYFSKGEGGEGGGLLSEF